MKYLIHVRDGVVCLLHFSSSFISSPDSVPYPTLPYLTESGWHCRGEWIPGMPILHILCFIVGIHSPLANGRSPLAQTMEVLCKHYVDVQKDQSVDRQTQRTPISPGAIAFQSLVGFTPHQSWQVHIATRGLSGFAGAPGQGHDKS